MSTQEINTTIIWAEELANKHNLGVNVIINAFVTARSELGDSDKAKRLVEQELEERHKKLGCAS
ncbi:MAG: hypothetical protein ACRDDX_10445 [Cellulosilyticaceae bacterium]